MHTLPRCLIIGAVGLLLWGCRNVPAPTGIPNIHVVDAKLNILRGGQPEPGGWVYLHQHGISNVVKLNTYEEAKDHPTGPLGYDTEAYHPIEFYQQLTSVPEQTVMLAVSSMSTPGTFVHCQHGEDRTGLIVAFYRWRIQHWSRDKAEQEMLAFGFHKELHGLWDFWEDGEFISPDSNK